MIENSRVLFVLGGLAMGGVETYVVRLTKELTRRGCSVDVLLLSARYDAKLMSELSTFAHVSIFENAGFLSASSWVNAFYPVRQKISEADYDIVHVVDVLTLGFVFLNRDIIRTKYMSIGIYHAKELSWWRDRQVYFRTKLLELYDRNVTLTLFPNESMIAVAAKFAGVSAAGMRVLPLGVDLTKYKRCSPARTSRRIVSVGRLVDFKTYTRHIISELQSIRRFGDFEYHIYGEGPEKEALQKLAADCNVGDYVHFKGGVDYEKLPDILGGCFCFVGSGTSIIEASAAGIPSIVGIESIKVPETCGLFSEVSGADYNEQSATTRRVAFVEVFQQLSNLSEADYLELSNSHKRKASEFDLQNTSHAFLTMSNQRPDFNFSFSRWRAIVSFFYSLIRFGPQALKSRFDQMD